MNLEWEVLEEYSDQPSAEDLRIVEAEKACREKHGGDHPWSMEFEGGSFSVSCAAKECPFTFDDIYPDWRDIAYLPPIPVVVNIATSRSGGHEHPYEYDVDITIDLNLERDLDA